MTIVLVEDDKTLRRYMSIALEAYGYEVISHGDVDRLFEKSAWEGVEILLLDLILKRGKKETLELMHWLRANDVRVRVIVLTGWVVLRNYDDVLVRLSDKIMSKPVDMEELVQAIEEFREEDNA